MKPSYYADIHEHRLNLPFTLAVQVLRPADAARVVFIATISAVVAAAAGSFLGGGSGGSSTAMNVSFVLLVLPLSRAEERNDDLATSVVPMDIVSSIEIKMFRDDCPGFIS